MAHSQEFDDSWFTPPGDKAGIVVLINGDTETPVSITDNQGKILAEAKGIEGPVALQVLLKPDVYQVYLPKTNDSPVQRIEIVASPRKLSFLEFSPFLPEIGPGGFQLTVWPQTVWPQYDIKTAKAVEEKFKALGYTTKEPPRKVDPTENIIFVNSDPPWKIRPKPKPPDPPPE